MDSSADSLAVRILRWLAGSVYRYPRVFFYPQMVLFAVSVFYTVQHLKFSTVRSDLVGADKQYHRNFMRYRQEFISQDEMVAVVESENMEKNRQFVERLGARLLAETNLFTDVIFNNDVKMLGNKALLFFPEAELTQLHQTLQDYRPFLQQFARASNLHSLFRVVNQQFRTARREQGAETDSLIRALPALERIVREATASLQRPGVPPSPGVTALFGAGEEAERRIYITFDHGRFYLVMARARAEKSSGDAVRRFRELVAETKAEVPGINAAITGEPVLEIDEMAQSQADTLIATIVSLVLVALIFIYGYSQTGRPLKATFCLIIGLGFTMGFTTLVIGHLNILSITFAPMLIGLAIDFGVHLITRYEEELRGGRSEREAIEKAIVYTGQGIFTGCFTTAGAFLAMALTDFKGIQEMGIISGGGLLICLVPMITLLPVLLLRGKQNILDHTYPHAVERRARIEKLWLERPMAVTLVTTILCVAAFSKFSRVHFDYNLLNMQSKGLPAVVFSGKLINSAEKSVLYCAIIAKSLQEAVVLESRITNLPSVASVDSMTRFLLEDQTRKLTLVSHIKRDVAGIKFAEADQAPANISELSDAVRPLQGYLALAEDEVAAKGDVELVRQLGTLRQALLQLQQRMLADSSVAKIKLAAFQRAVFRDLHQTFAAIRDQDDRGRLTAEDLPPALRHRFVSRHGDLYALQIYPRKDVWQRDNQEEFVRELRRIDPNVTGTPVQLLEYTTLLKQSYQTAAYYALGAIALLVWIHFRSLPCVILSLLPVGVGTIWMVGFMGWFGIPFNPANIMTLPLVIGIGVTNGIHILNRFAEEKKPSILAKSTGKAVLISGLTTIIGFGSLTLAKHRGINSLGYVMSVGTATCMIAALTLLPAILNLMSHRGWNLIKKKTR